MGRRKHHAPRRGSLAFLPRQRASRLVPTSRYWPPVEETVLLGFPGYKVGMTHVFHVDEDKRSPTYGKELFAPATVVETPPLTLCALRAYENRDGALRTFTEAWASKLPRELERVLTLPERLEPEKGLAKMEENLERLACVRAVVATNPKLAGFGKKKPEILELGVGGTSAAEQFNYLRGLLGKELDVSHVLKEGQFVDVVAVTKGKGFQGPVKRWGIKKLPHKSRKTVRGVGCIGPWHPAKVMFTVPRAGQMGFHRRTELNKLVLKIGFNGDEVNPKGGWLRYGLVRSAYVLLKGSIPGPAKRCVLLRYSARMPTTTAPVRLEWLSLEPKM